MNGTTSGILIGAALGAGLAWRDKRASTGVILGAALVGAGVGAGVAMAATVATASTPNDALGEVVTDAIIQYGPGGV